MKKLTVLVFFIFVTAFSCQSAEKRGAKESINMFKERLSETRLLIRQIVPPGFSPVPIDPEVPFGYHYALLSDNKDIEIRYVVRSIPAKLKSYAEFKKQNPNAVLVPPKKDDYIRDFAMILINLSTDPINYSSNDFPKKAVKDEFGADWGNSSLLELNPSYDKKYRFCSMTTLHKDGEADVYMLYLSNDVEKLTKFLKSTHLFYNLRFL